MASFRKIIVFFLLSVMSLRLNAAGDDSARFHNYLQQFLEYEFNDTLKAVNFLTEATVLAEKKGNAKMLGLTYRYWGWYHQDQFRHFEALESFATSMKYFVYLGDLQGIADSYGNIGNVYEYLGDYATAIEYQHKSLLYNDKILLSEKDSVRIRPAITGKAYAMGNIGNLYEAIKDHEKALEYMLQSLELEKKYKLSSSLDASYTNLGIVYRSLKNYDKSLECHLQSLRIRLERNEINNLGSSYQNISLNYMDKKNYDSAVLYINKAIEADEKHGNQWSLTHSLSNKAKLMYEMSNYREAIDLAARSIKIAEDHNTANRTIFAHELMYAAYNNLQNYKEALKHYVRMDFLEDSLKRSEVNEAMIRKSMLYEFNSQKLSDSLERAQQDELLVIKHENEIGRQKTYAYGAIAGLSVVAIIAVVLFRGYRQKQKNNILLEQKNTIISHQKELVEEKNKEITDSINYAKRLQEAILPRYNDFKEEFKDSFILYMPKDIVAGDFYFFEKTDTHIFVAAADCTGHGVPGAMVSVVCSNALNRAVKEFKLTDPGEILDKVTDLVIETFAKSESEVKDGMDISLGCFSFDVFGSSLEMQQQKTKNKKQKTLFWSGANNPLWIVNKLTSFESDESFNAEFPQLSNFHNLQLTEIKPDKQPVGSYTSRKKFTTHSIELQKGDTVYIFTDGFADQFGGVQGKKFKQKKLKELLLEISGEELNLQEQKLKEAILSWKGDLEQNDDITILGIRM